MNKTQAFILRLVIYIFVGIALIVYVSNHPVPFGSAWMLYYSGKKLHAQKQYRQAEDTFKRVIRMKPQMGKAHLMLGVVYTDQERFQEAEQEFKKALDGDLATINRIITYNNLGSIYLEHLFSPDLAIEALNNALKVQPGFIDPEVDPYLILARAYLAKADFDQSIRMARESVRTHPDSSAGLVNLGNAYLAKGDIVSARKIYETLKAVNKAEARGLLEQIDSAEEAEKKKQEFLNKFAGSLETTENAALLYSDAGFKVIGMPPPEFFPIFKNMTDGVFSRGWQKQDEGLRTLLENNRPALEQFRKAASLGQCDFLPEYTLGSAGFGIGFFVSGKTMDLVRLVLLDAKRKEYGRDLDAAIQDYMVVLRFIEHLEAQQGAGLVKVFLKNNVEGPLFVAIKGFINRPDVSAFQVRQLLDTLASLCSGRKSIAAFFREEMQASKDLIIFDASIQELRRKGKEKYIAEAFSEFTRMMDKAEAILIDAAEKNTPESARRQINSLTSGVLGKNSQVIVAAHLLQAVFSRKPFPQPSYLAKMWVALAMPQYISASAIQRFLVIRLKEDLFVVGVALRLYEIEKAKAAERLEQLVPEYLAALPKDPFNGFKPVSYAKTSDGWVLYSFGPDKKDDRGQVVFDRMKDCNSKACPGDVVF